VVAIAVAALPARAADAPSASARHYALIVGINEYDHLGKLECCRQDAEAVAKVLVENAGYDPVRVCLLTDGQAKRANLPTYANLLRRLKQFTELPGKGDTLLIFFAGHGLTIDDEAYLMPANGSDKDTGVGITWLRQRIENCNATSKILILDACHSGKATRGVLGIAPSAAQGAATLVLTSCNEMEISYPQNGHGVFTAGVVSGLSGAADKNKDKQVTAAELFAAVKDHVEKWSIDSGNTQTPQMSPPDGGGLIVAKLVRRRVVEPPKRPRVKVYAGWPFDSAEARRRQRETARALGVPVEKTVDLGGGVKMEFVLVPAGEFVMGSKLSAAEVVRKYGGQEDWYKVEHPAHRVRITKPFYLGKHEVTREQFARFVDDARYRTDAEKEGSGFAMTKEGPALVEGLSWRRPGIKQGANHPVVQISWKDADAFCKWLSKKTGRRIALPTEAEWEYACRAGADSPFWFGSTAEDGKGKLNWCDEAANKWVSQYDRHFDENVEYDDGYGTTAPVGRYDFNAWGLYDMHGNVWEWCGDRYDGDYYGNSPKDDPKGPGSGSARVVRGGSWFFNPRFCRSAYRRRFLPSNRSNIIGCRLVLRDF